MRVRVRHLTRVRYAAPVALGPHELRLTPRGARGMAHGIRVTPDPAFRYDATDRHGNRVTRLGFTGKTALVEVEVRFDLDTARIVRPAGETARPVEYLLRSDTGVGGGDAATAGDRQQDRAQDRDVTATARRLRALAGPDPDAFAESLASTLHGAIAIDAGDAAPLRAPGETLARGRGSLRDLVALYVELSRRAGLPTRFVSGYWVQSPDRTAPRALRSWAEVLLPDRGWQGYDPTLGLRAGDSHIALAAAPDFAGTLPISGSTFATNFGISVQSTAQLDLSIQAWA